MNEPEVLTHVLRGGMRDGICRDVDANNSPCLPRQDLRSKPFATGDVEDILASYEREREKVAVIVLQLDGATELGQKAFPVRLQATVIHY